jgi:hypothetical protein
MPWRSLGPWVLVLGALGAIGACSNGGSSGSSSGPSGGSRGDGEAGAGSGGIAPTGGVRDSGTQAGAAGDTNPGSGGTSATGGAEAAGTAGTGSPYPNVGVCGRRGKATADATSFEAGYEERYLVGEEGFGTDICVVRFDLARVGDGPSGCTVCSFTHLLEYGSSSVVTDTDGVCARSDLGLDEAGIAEIVGSRVAIGFAEQLGGAHGSARMTYAEATGTWDVTGNATWNETTNAFSYNYREGLCNYGP